MPGASPSALQASSYPLRDKRILAALAGDGSLSFQGLRRLLGLHPQALSRSLRRLRDAGLVTEEPGGYRLVAPAESGLLPPLPVQQSAVLLALALESAAGAKLVEGALTGRWFRSLHWLGKARAGNQVVLAWLVEPEGVVIRLVMDPEQRVLRVEVAEEARDDPPVHAAVRSLMAAIPQGLSPPLPAGPGARLLLAA